MLSTNPLIAFIPSKDTSRARSFYEGVLGLRFVSDDAFAIVMDSNGTMIRIVRVGEFTPAPFTILGWQVDDIHAKVAELSGNGVQFNR
jgi:catechol 2,3-dioxygenase-like lactoylglutathione lyase family enzyme